MFEVSVKTLDGNSKTFQIEDEELTIAGFKEKISSDMDIPIDRQRLIFQGKLLADDRKLKDCDVASKTIHLVPRPPPAPGTEAGPSTGANDEDQTRRNGFPPFQGISETLNSLLQPFNPSASDFNPARAAHRLFSTFQRQANYLLNRMDGSNVNTVSSDNQTLNPDLLNPTVDQPESSSEQQSQQQEVPPLDFARLADMVAEQRILWHRLSPYLDQFEAMLRHENATRTANQTVISTDGEPMDISNDTDSPTPTSNVEWSDALFNCVSSALHLHAHMLHFLSDFNFVPEAPRRRRGNMRSRSITAVNQSSTDDSQSTSATLQPASPSPSPSNTRSLYLREPNSSVLHAHINIEPTVVTIARPVVNVTNGDAEVRRRSQSAHPLATNAPTSTISEAVTAATNTPGGISSGTTEGSTTEGNTTATTGATTNGNQRIGGIFELPTAVVFDSPLIGGGPLPGNLTNQILETIYNQLGQAFQSNLESTQTPAPAATNTTNSDADNDSTTTTTTANSTSTSPGTTARHSDIRNMASSGATNLPSGIPFPPFLSYGSGDPFLPCGSRHSILGARARNVLPRSSRRRSFIRSNIRRGHSVGAPQTRSSTTTPTSATSGSQSQPVSSQPLGSVRSLMEMASGQLNQILSEFGVPTTSDTGGNAVFTGTGSRMGIDSILHRFPRRNLANQPMDSSYSIYDFPQILIEGLIRDVWSAIYQIARNQIPGSVPTLPVYEWEDGLLTYRFSAFAENSLIRPLIASVVTPSIAVNFLRTVDSGRTNFLRALNENLLTATGSGSAVRPEVVNLLLNSFPTDDSNFSSPERELYNWVNERAAEIGTEPLDIRRSFYNFLQDNLSRHLSLWTVDRTLPGVLGNVLLNSLEILMTELYAFCHLLVQRGVEALGLHLNNTADSLDSVVEVFGHSLSFVHLFEFLLSHYRLERPTTSEMPVQMLISGMNQLQRSFHTNGVTRFNENRERLESYLQTRPIPPSASANRSVTESPRQEGHQSPPVIKNDTLDVYMDANEEIPNSAQQANPTDSTSGLFTEWAAQETPISTTEALAPNSLSNWRPSVNSADCPPVPEAFPQEWTEVVASDVRQMSTDYAQQQQENDVADESTPSVRRLSDAYIAGMPIKRRRIMMERKHKLTNSPNELFMNLLKEAMSSQVPIASPAGPVEIENGDVTEEVAFPLSQVSPPHDVSDAFRAYLTEHLSRRLASDPDFDAERHTAAEEVFGNRSCPSSSNN